MRAPQLFYPSLLVFYKKSTLRTAAIRFSFTKGGKKGPKFCHPSKLLSAPFVPFRDCEALKGMGFAAELALRSPLPPTHDFHSTWVCGSGGPNAEAICWNQLWAIWQKTFRLWTSVHPAWWKKVTPLLWEINTCKKKAILLQSVKIWHCYTPTHLITMLCFRKK